MRQNGLWLFCRFLFRVTTIVFLQNRDFCTKYPVMTALEIKDKLHQMVSETDDVDVLEQIALLFSALRDEKSLWDTIGEAEKVQIQRGLEDLHAGRTKSNEEVRAKVREILIPRRSQ